MGLHPRRPPPSPPRRHAPLPTCPRAAHLRRLPHHPRARGYVPASLTRPEAEDEIRSTGFRTKPFGRTCISSRRPNSCPSIVTTRDTLAPSRPRHEKLTMPSPTRTVSRSSVMGPRTKYASSCSTEPDGSRTEPPACRRLQRPEEHLKFTRLCELLAPPMKFQPAPSMRLHELTNEAPTILLHQRSRRQRVTPPRHPERLVTRQHAARHDAVDMHVMHQLLAPRMQHCEHPGRPSTRARTLPSASLPRSTARFLSEAPWIDQGEVRQHRRDCEDDVIVWNWENVLTTPLEPVPSIARRARRTVPIATAIVLLMPPATALAVHPATAEHRSPAALHVPKKPTLSARQVEAEPLRELRRRHVPKRIRHTNPSLARPRRVLMVRRPRRTRSLRND